jgi:asparagine N-glycosylation enzyme membrane subunit Stt3
MTEHRIIDTDGGSAGSDAAGPRAGKGGGRTSWGHMAAFAAAFLIIIVAVVYLRCSMLQYQGMFEPDGFYYYSIATAAVNNNFVVPQYDALSGFPSHNLRGEQAGLEYLSIIPYIVLRYFGIGDLEIMRLMPVLFGVLYAVLAYLLAKQLSNSRALGLLAMFFVAVSSGNIARTAALVYRGDSFIALPLLVALLLMLKALDIGRSQEAGAKGNEKVRRALSRIPRGSEIVKRHIEEEKALQAKQHEEMRLAAGLSREERGRIAALHREDQDRLLEEHIREERLLLSDLASTGARESGLFDRKRIAYVVLLSVVLSTGLLVWTGASYIFAVYMLALLLLTCYSFVSGSNEIAETNVLLTLGLLIAYALDHLYVYIGGTYPGVLLYSAGFFVFYIPMLLASIVVMYLVRNKEKFAVLEKLSTRAILLIAMVLVASLIAFIPMTSYLHAAFGNAATATNTTASPIGSTTQELQVPGFGFLFASFNLQLYLAPLGVILFILLSLLFFLLPGLFRNSRYLKADELPSNLTGFIAAFSYLVITAYMQSLAIRYNALVSIPIAIFAAYGLYAIGAIVMHVIDVLVKDRDVEGRMLAAISASVLEAMLLYYAIHKGIPVFSPNLYAAVDLLFMGVLGVVAAYSMYQLYLLVKGRKIAIALLVGIAALAVYLSLAAVIMSYNLYNCYGASLSAGPADGVNPLFLDAMTWMSNNTPANATVIDVWPDGSVVEAWAHRTSYLDSVGGENGTRILKFTSFLFNDSMEANYLYSIGKPQYLISRNFWYDELGGLAIEGLVQNASAYGFVLLNTMHVTQNGTTQFYEFQSSSPAFCLSAQGVEGNCDGITYTEPVYYRAEMVLQPQKNGTGSSTAAYIGTSASNRLTGIKYVIFYNQSNYNYTIVGSPISNALNYTLLVTYVNRTITGGVLLGIDLPQSNLFKFTFLCNYYVCPFGDSNISMRAVFINGDSRILKITYH